MKKTPKPVIDTGLTARARLIDESEAAELLGQSRRTLQAWRLNGRGPTFAKIGRSVRYAPADLDRFIEAGRRINTAGGTPR